MCSALVLLLTHQNSQQSSVSKMLQATNRSRLLSGDSREPQERIVTLGVTTVSVPCAWEPQRSAQRSAQDTKQSNYIVQRQGKEGSFIPLYYDIQKKNLYK